MFKFRRSILFSIFLLGIFAFLLGGCDRKGKNIPINPPTVTTHLQDAWTFFENHDYENAIHSFTAAKDRDALSIDAYSGLAWSFSRTQEYLNAVSNFQIFLSLTDDELMMANAYAGLAFNSSASGDDSAAIAFVEKTLALAPEYRFQHDPKINSQALYVLAAKSYCNMGEFLKALQEVEKNIESGFTQNLLSGNVILIAEDDTVVVSSSDLLTGDAVGTATKEVVVGTDTLEVDAELVKILSIESVDKTVEYTLTGFAEGGGEIRFFGTPIVQKRDKVLATYYYANDYGVFLSRLFQKIAELQN